MYDQILYEVAEPAAIITLNRPKQLNAWTDRMGAEVKHAMAQAEADKRVVAIILTGAGRGFCAGADMFLLKSISEGGSAEKIPAELAAASPGDPTMGDDFRGTYTYLLSIRKPVIAAVNGPVAGMAVPIVACCDLRFASPEASFMTAFSKRGLIAEWGSSWILPRLFGSGARAGSPVLGAQGRCRRSRTHRPRQPRRGRRGAARLRPPVRRGHRRQLLADLDDDHEAAGLSAPDRRPRPAEKEAIALMLDSFKRPDFREGVVSFLEKRPPRFPRV